MNGWLPSFVTMGWLLAEQSRYSGMGRRFRHSGLDVQDILWLGVLLAIGTLIVYLLIRWTSWRAKYYASQPCGVFRELCRAHGLKWRERRLLIALARAQQVKSPAQLFLEPQRFAVEGAGARLARYAERIAALRQRLFAKSSSTENDRPPTAAQ